MSTLQRISALALSFSALLLAGCSTNFDLPSTTTATSNVGTIQGSVFGGQQPVAQAHVFVMAVGVGNGTTGDAGPGITASTSNKATSLIPITASGATLDSTIGGYYVQTDASGYFNITADYTCTLGTEVYILALQGKADGVNNNPSIGMMAVLGNCPNGGTFSTTYTNPIHVNEISTVAAAFALAGFATDSWHISSNGSSLAQTGVKNAAANAAQLFNLMVVPVVANTTTPNGAGTVPQTLIHSIANSLAACINSASPSFTTCTTLFGDAKSAGSSGTTPTDTATAAINIAHNPGTNVTAIYNLGTGTPPFTGLGSAPSDFSIGVTYSGFNEPYSVAIDGSGNAWVVNTIAPPNGLGSIIELSPLGAVLATYANSSTNGINNPLAIAIDQNSNAWIPSYDITKISGGAASKIIFADDANGGWYVAIDKNNDPWFSTYQDTKVYNLNQSGTGLTGSPYSTGSAQSEQIATDSNGNVWAVYGNSAGLVHIANPGSSATVTEYLQSSLPNVRANSGIAIDSNNHIWAVAQTTGLTNGVSNECLIEYSFTTTLNEINCYNDTGMQGDGVAIDGAGNVWVANGQITGGIGGVEFSNSGTLLSPAGGYSGGAQSYPISVAVDGSGDVWLPGNGASYTGTTMVELIGVAVPVVTPISPNYPGKSTTGLGIRP